MDKKKLKVLIVGAGPTGLTLANYLAQSDIDITIIEKRDCSSTITRAIGINQSTIDVFNDLGLGEKLLNNCLLSRKTSLYWSGKRLVNFDFKWMKTDSYFYYTKQPIVEDILLSSLFEKGVQVKFKTELIDLNRIDDHVLVKFCSDNGDIAKEQFDLVVGCDGSNSIVADKLKVSYDEQDYGSYFNLADVNLSWDGNNDNAHYFLDNDGYLMVIPIPGGLHRLIVAKKGTYDPDNLEREKIKKWEELVNAKSPIPIKINDFVWHAGSQFRHKIAMPFKSKNICLAGDAYHIFSPVGGINMNMGIRDAAVLSRKINTAVCNDGCIADVISEYQQERQNTIEKNMSQTRAATFAITQSGHADENYKNKFLPKMSNRKFMRTYLENYLKMQ